MRLLIDGYNVIFTCGLHGTRRTSDALQRARNKLIRLLTQYLTPQQRSHTTVVFDAKQVPIADLPQQEAINGIAILYAVDFPDADSLIESLIGKHSVPRKLTVVSSDHRIQTAATRRKATAIDSDRWLDQLEAGKPTRSESVDVPTPSLEKQLPAELAEVDWIEAFTDGGSPESPESVEDRPQDPDDGSVDELSFGSVDHWTRIFESDDQDDHPSAEN